MNVGVLAIQGSFAEHKNMCEAINIECKLIRSKEDLESITHLIIPGGESTTMLKLLKRFGMWKILKDKLQKKSLKIFGTCAGAILCSYLGMDLEVERNAYGAQQDSMMTPLKSELFPGLTGAFIRAPKLINISDSVKILATDQGKAVMAEQGPFLVASFHPELVGETKIYKYFLKEF